MSVTPAPAAPGNSGPVKTEGVSPKVPSQAFATIVTFILAKYGIDLGTEESAAIATILGFLAGFATPPGRVRPA
jgi:hypothetical protein